MARAKSQQSPFGRESRRNILAKHFNAKPVVVDRAWEFVYRELLWIDGSTGLAHLYESDKAQPGRSVWYDRSVVFTDRLCVEFGCDTRERLKTEIDALFKECLQLLIASRKKTPIKADVALAVVEDSGESLLTDVVEEPARVADEPSGYVPDADLVAEFARILALQCRVATASAERIARELVSKARYYFTVERKRQNVLGEGFEDLLELLIAKLTTVGVDRIIIRKKADELPGFQTQASRDRIEAPDLAVVMNNETKLLASIKWSLRHDRQKQLSDELDCYAGLLSQDAFPRYILITNEYDPGRLINTNALERRGQKISCIYHVNPELLRAVLADGQKYTEELLPLVKAGRLRSIGDFLADLESSYGHGAARQPLTADQRRQVRRRTEK